MADKIDAAIEAAAAEPPEAHSQTTVRISSTGRHVVMSFPTDMTDQELLEFIGWLGASFRLGLIGERAKKESRIVPVRVVPAGLRQ
jgi:hypothetical protein